MPNLFVILLKFSFITLLVNLSIGKNVTLKHGFDALWNLNQMSECKLGYSAIAYNDYGCWFVFLLF
jgi:hypothetical protein